MFYCRNSKEEMLVECGCKKTKRTYKMQQSGGVRKNLPTNRLQRNSLSNIRSYDRIIFHVPEQKLHEINTGQNLRIHGKRHTRTWMQHPGK